MIGSRMRVLAGDRTIWRRARSDGSYASAHDPCVLAGLGDAWGPVRVQVTWSSGRTEEWTDVAVDRWATFLEGAAK